MCAAYLVPSFVCFFEGGRGCERGQGAGGEREGTWGKATPIKESGAMGG